MSRHFRAEGMMLREGAGDVSHVAAMLLSLSLSLLLFLLLLLSFQRKLAKRFLLFGDLLDRGRDQRQEVGAAGVGARDTCKTLF